MITAIMILRMCLLLIVVIVDDAVAVLLLLLVDGFTVVDVFAVAVLPVFPCHYSSHYCSCRCCS